MITLTQMAKDKIDQYFSENEAGPIRIFLHQGGCSGPFLGLALDAPGDADTTVEVEGYTFVMESALFEQAKPVTVDLGPMGFMVSSSLKLERASGGCGCGSSSGGGCGTGSGGGCGSGGCNC